MYPCKLWYLNQAWSGFTHSVSRMLFTPPGERVSSYYAEHGDYPARSSYLYIDDDGYQRIKFKGTNLFTSQQVETLHKVLEYPLITPEERNEMKKVGFTDEFILDVAGEDGHLTKRRRVTFLLDRATSRWSWIRGFFGGYTRLGAVNSLAGYSDDDRVVPCLIDRAKNDEDSVVRETALRGLCHLLSDDPRVTALYNDRSENDANEAVRKIAADGLAGCSYK